MMMNFYELTDLCKSSSRRYALIGDRHGGIVAGLDLAGRLFAVLDGDVLNRVNPAAFEGQSSAEEFLNPGGDGLWPAPEGTSLGYEYATGSWRVPPGITGARYRIIETGPDRALIRAEIDLINNVGIGLPTAFERDIRIAVRQNELKVSVTESITYLGAINYDREHYLLAPWSLCQFDSGPGSEVIFPGVNTASIWDLYDASDEQRRLQDGLWHTCTDAAQRYQIGLGPEVEWIEYHCPEQNLVVRRSAGGLAPGWDYVDIRDVSPAEKPAAKGVRFSVYSDPSGFMEIEAVGGCCDSLTAGLKSALTTVTTYTRPR